MSKAGTCYYSVLGICKQASASEIRDAYRRQALVEYLFFKFIF